MINYSNEKTEPIKNAVKILAFLWCVFFTGTLIAQAPSDSSSVDMHDVLKRLFSKHKQQRAEPENISPKKVAVTILPAVGYSLQTDFAVALNSEIAFSTDTLLTQKMSTINTSVTYTVRHQILFPIISNIWFKKNGYNLITDYRVLKYPITNYGIGIRTTSSDGYTLNFNYIKLHQTLLKKIYKEIYGGVGFYYDYFWNIGEVDPPANVVTSFQKYGAVNKEVASGIAFKLLYDSRTNQINPAQGTYANVIFRPNYTFLGSDNQWQSLQMEYRKYLHIFNSKKNVLAIWSYNWFSLGKEKPPYLLLPSTGWDDQYNTGRGYIQSRFRDRNMVYLETEYRFGITRNGLLGAVVFANAQSLSDKFSGLLNVCVPAVGGGLRVKLNKRANTNLCIDYGFGLNGSRGVFLNLGEIF